MKAFFEALASLARLEPILALMDSAEQGQQFAVGETYEVRPDADDDQLLLLKDGALSPLLRVSFSADEVRMKMQAPPWVFTDEMTVWLRLLGCGKDGRPICLGAPAQQDEVARRLRVLEHAWIFVHRAEHLHDTLEGRMALWLAARDVRATRDTLFELENTSRATPGQIRRAQQQFDAALERVTAFAASLKPGAKLKVEDDPRGASLRLEVEGPRGFTMFLAGMDLNWHVPEQIDLAQEPLVKGRAKRGVQSADSQGTPPAASSISAPTTTKVDADVIAALQSAVADGKLLRITEQLDAKTYTKVKRYLASLGGKWKTNLQAHVFDRDAQQVLSDLLGGSVVTDRDWEFFPTPDDVVQRMLQHAGIQPGMTVLEPSAGQGALALPAAKRVGIDNVTCVEAMPSNAQRLRDKGFDVMEADFLTIHPEPTFDVILMNPPFGQLRDTAHITHAMGFLKPGGRLVAIASTSWRHREVPKAQAFKVLLHSHQAHIEDVAAGAFRESGTDVATVLIAMTAKEQPTRKPTPQAPQASKPAKAPVAPPQPQLTLELFDAFEA